MTGNVVYSTPGVWETWYLIKLKKPIIVSDNSNLLDQKLQLPIIEHLLSHIKVFENQAFIELRKTRKTSVKITKLRPTLCKAKLQEVGLSWKSIF